MIKKRHSFVKSSFTASNGVIVKDHNEGEMTLTSGKRTVVLSELMKSAILEWIFDRCGARGRKADGVLSVNFNKHERGEKK